MWKYNQNKLWYNKFKKKNLISLRLLHDKSTRSGNAAPRSIHVIPIYLCIEGTWDAVI